MTVSAWNDQVIYGLIQRANAVPVSILAATVPGEMNDPS
jgi:hypothetical protein